MSVEVVTENYRSQELTWGGGPKNESKGLWVAQGPGPLMGLGQPVVGGRGGEAPRKLTDFNYLETVYER